LIVRLAAQSNLSAVAIFGSVARGESTESSDLDLLVDTTAETSLIDMARFERDMETLFEVPVDVIARSSLDPERDEAILREAIAL
jgi:predicted nucleotidyltransferase